MMKKTLVSLLGMLLLNCCFSQENNFTINGYFSKIRSGKIFLITYENDVEKRDTAMIINGSYFFEGTVSKPVYAVLDIEDGKADYQRFILDQENITINGKGYPLDSSKISNSPVNIDADLFLKMISPQRRKADDFDKLYQIAIKNKDVRLADSVDLLMEGLAREERIEVKNFIDKNAGSRFSPFLIMKHFSSYAEAEDVAPLYYALSPQIKKTAAGHEVKKLIDIYSSLAVGRPAPEIIQQDTLGNTVKLSSFIGKYVLIDFWASWCGPCRKENPNIKKAYQQYKTKGLEILGVSFDNISDNGAAKWKAAIVKDGLPWPQISDLKGWDNACAKDYYINSIPSNVLIDPQGIIIAKNLLGQKLNDRLQLIFK